MSSAGAVVVTNKGRGAGGTALAIITTIIVVVIIAITADSLSHSLALTRRHTSSRKSDRKSVHALYHPQ